MNDLITYREITSTTGLVWSTINHRIKSIGIKPTTKKKSVAGRPQRAVTRKQLVQIIEYTPKVAHITKIYTTPKTEQTNDRFSQSAFKGLNTENRLRIEKKLEKITALSTNCPELNMSNYSEDQVEELNDKMIEIYCICQLKGESE